MCTAELVKKLKRSSKTITKTQRRERLISAKILDKDLNYNSKYFTRETVQASKSTKTYS